MENMEDIFKKLAAAGAASFSNTLIKDIVEIGASKNSNMVATAKIIAHIAVANTLLEILAGQGVNIPGDMLVSMGETIGREEGKRMVSELGFMGSSLKVDKADGSDPEVKNSWRNQL